MKEIIIKYLDKNYMFTLSTYVSYNLYDKNAKIEVRLKEVLDNIMFIFNLDSDQLRLVFDDWADKKAIEMQNKVTDLRYKLYLQTGIELQLTPHDLNQLLKEDDELGELFNTQSWFTNYDKPI